MEVLNRKAGPAILVVDDDPVCRLFCVQALSASGYQTLSAADGENAISLAVQIQPAVMLTDLHLPDISGAEVMVRIRELWPEARIPTRFVAMSGDDSNAARAAVRNADFNDMLTKPFAAEALLECVEKAQQQPGGARKSRQQDAPRNPVLKQEQNSQGPELQAIFCMDLNQQVAEIDRLLTVQDWKRAADLLHRLSGGAALAGFSGLAGQGRQLLQLLSGPKDIALLAQTYLDFLREVSEARENRSQPA